MRAYSLAADDEAGRVAAARLPRLLPAGDIDGPVSLGDHLARYGSLPEVGSRHRSAAIAEVDRAGLSGRGGAGFPTGRKLAAAASGTNPVVVGNGTEGEPAIRKDRLLMARSPHLVLDGAVAAADLVGAREAVIVAHPGVIGLVAAAAGQRRRARLDPIKIKVIPAAEGFVAGEASAVTHWIERGVPMPRWSAARLSDRGLHGRPTLVHNVETLAHLALIARYGARWFRAIGTADEPGSMLVTVTGAVRNPGVVEVAIGTPVADVIGLAGGPAERLGALLLGGYFGTWVDPARAAGLPFSDAGLRRLNAGVGAGLVLALPASANGLTVTAHITRYLAGESAGQCGPCVFGLDAIASQVERLADGRGADRIRLHRWIGQLWSGRGACKHPDGVVRMVASALGLFGA